MGGGVGFFVRNDVNCKWRDDLTIFDDHCESLFIEIDKSVFGSGRDLLIAVIYRPPNTDMKLFIDAMRDVLEKVQQENKLLYLVGDYNINLLNVDSHSSTADFNDTIYSYGLVPLITRPTRVTETSATLIYNIFTNKSTSYDESMYGILMSDISGHYPIFCIDKILKHKTINISYLQRDYSEKNKINFLNDISVLDWQDVYSAADAQHAFSLFHKKLIDLHDSHFPEKSITKRYYTRKPWLTSCLRDAIRKKNKLYYKSVKIKCMRTRKEYELYRNQLRKLLRVAEKKHYADRISENKHNSKRLWMIIKSVINRNKKTKFQDKFKFNDGSYTTDMKIICEKFNDFFINVGPSLSKKIPPQISSPDDYIKTKAVYSLYLEPVTESEITKLVTSLKSAAPGYDNLRSSILKLSLPFICTPLTYLSNLSLQEGVFPDELKIANVIPLFKCDNPELFNNYRPVSVLCSVSKFFEKIMYNRLRSFLGEHKTLFSYQFGFCKSNSTYMALMTLMDNLINFLDNGEFVIGIFLDFSKSFDTVDHGILLQKLSSYGVRGEALLWFQSYLSNRYQFVT